MQGAEFLQACLAAGAFPLLRMVLYTKAASQHGQTPPAHGCIQCAPGVGRAGDRDAVRVARRAGGDGGRHARHHKRAAQQGGRRVGAQRGVQVPAGGRHRPPSCPRRSWCEPATCSEPKPLNISSAACGTLLAGPPRHLIIAACARIQRLQRCRHLVKPSTWWTLWFMVCIQRRAHLHHVYLCRVDRQAC